MKRKVFLRLATLFICAAVFTVPVMAQSLSAANCPSGEAGGALTGASFYGIIWEKTGDDPG